MFSGHESFVMWSVFEEVVVRFLLVGHTHEDIDWAFNRTSNILRVNYSITLHEYHDALRRAYNGNTAVNHLFCAANWSGLSKVKACLSVAKSGFTKFRYFRFVKSMHW